MSQYHVSVTGMELTSIFSYPLFIKYAPKSVTQAKNADGIVKAETTYRNGIHHTLSIWENKESMQKYFRSGSHKEAVTRSKEMSSFVKVYGYGSDEIPTMDSAIKLWEEKGRVVYRLKATAKSANRLSVKSVFWSGFALFAVLFAVTQILPARDVIESANLLG